MEEEKNNLNMFKYVLNILNLEYFKTVGWDLLRRETRQSDNQREYEAFHL
jgi:hypothetical protein